MYAPSEPLEPLSLPGLPSLPQSHHQEPSQDPFQVPNPPEPMRRCNRGHNAAVSAFDGDRNRCQRCIDDDHRRYRAHQGAVWEQMVDQSSPPPSSPVSSPEWHSPEPPRQESPLPPSSLPDIPPDLSDSQWDQELNDEDLRRGFGSAVSLEDQALLTKFQEELMKIQMEHCNSCHETWFDLKVKNGCCVRCRKDTKYTAENAMDPGPRPQFVLDDPSLELTQIEEMLIAPIHVVMQAHTVYGGQMKYSGHICNFVHDTSEVCQLLPILPEECEVIQIQREGPDHVLGHDVQQWLEWLVEHHPEYHQVTISQENLSQLPENGSVHGRLQSIRISEVGDEGGGDDIVGPSNGDEPDGALGGRALFTSGFIPNVNEE